MNIFVLACICLKALTEAKHVHAHILKSGFKMEQDGVMPDGATFVSIIKTCGRLGNLEQGKQIHDHIVKTGIKQDLVVKNTLIDMYAKCGSMDDAYKIFERMPICTVVTWTAIIAGYAKHGHGESALKIFRQMQKEGVKPDEVTFLSVLNACASIGNLKQGKELHAHILQSGIKPTIFMENALVDMYAKCGSMENAHIVFKRLHRRDVISWTAMIAGYVKLGHAEEAFNFFWQMQQEGAKPNEVTFLSILNACAVLSSLEEGKQIHAYIIKIGIKSNTHMESTLVDMYAKCGHIENARRMFDQMCRRDSISWNAMIAGYTQKGHPEEGFSLFQQMKQEHIMPDEGTFVSILNTCASIAALERGKEIHADIIKSGFDLDVFVGSALVDMYAKCANIKSARCVFSKMPKQDVVLWTAMITGYAHNGHDQDALQIVKQMCKEGTKLNDVTFLAVLLSCSHAGLVDEGCQFFDSVSQEQDVIPRMEHYTCIVDLLGRAGRLEEAETFIRRMTCRASAGVWMALLGACRIHGHVELAERVTDTILKLDPQNSSALVLLANIYAGAHSWVDQADMVKMMKDTGFSQLD